MYVLIYMLHITNIAFIYMPISIIKDHFTYQL